MIHVLTPPQFPALPSPVLRTGGDAGSAAPISTIAIQTAVPFAEAKARSLTYNTADLAEMFITMAPRDIGLLKRPGANVLADLFLLDALKKAQAVITPLDIHASLPRRHIATSFHAGVQHGFLIATLTFDMAISTIAQGLRCGVKDGREWFMLSVPLNLPNKVQATWKTWNKDAAGMVLNELKDMVLRMATEGLHHVPLLFKVNGHGGNMFSFQGPKNLNQFDKIAVHITAKSVPQNCAFPEVYVWDVTRFRHVTDGGSLIDHPVTWSCQPSVPTQAAGDAFWAN